MSTLQEITTGIENGIKLAAAGEPCDFRIAERHVFNYGEVVDNAIACGDNLAYMRFLLDNGYAGKIKCVYIDPPFFTKAKYSAVVDLRDDEGAKHKVKHIAYDDRFERNLECYIENITARLVMIKELLSDDGLLWVHLDWHSSHYVRVVLDELFGSKRFVNEIVWKYKSGGSGKKHFARKHDTLLLYAKSEKYALNIPEEKSYNRGLKPYRFSGINEYKDEYGWYTLVNMKDVWSIDMVGRTSSERNGYATQKPLELMKRIIKASSEPGDLVADFFCGSGSFVVAAQELGRRWVGCDSEELAVALAKKRIDQQQGSYMYYLPQGEDIYHKGLKMRMVDSEEMANGKKLFIYAVDSFTPDIEYGYIPLAARQAVKDIERNNPLELIDVLMIDPNHGEEFSAEITLTEGFDNIRFLSRGNVAFVAVDVFGKEYYFDGC